MAAGAWETSSLRAQREAPGIWTAQPLPGVNCSSGRFTLRLTVEDTVGTLFDDTQWMWVDNKAIHGELDGFPAFDAVMVPYNYVNRVAEGNLAKAVKKSGAALVAMKTHVWHVYGVPVT